MKRVIFISGTPVFLTQLRNVILSEAELSKGVAREKFSVFEYRRKVVAISGKEEDFDQSEALAMDAADSQCPKCEGHMERGFVFDQSLTSSRLLHWVEGEPERGGSSGLKLIGRKANEITRTDKCDKCGYLEFYASSDVKYL